MRIRRLHARLHVFVPTNQWHGQSGISMFVDGATLSAACAWIDKIRPFEAPRKALSSVKRFSTSLPFTFDTFTAKMAVFCDHLSLKNARASYPISLSLQRGHT
jgi:hypothetical protein